MDAPPRQDGPPDDDRWPHTGRRAEYTVPDWVRVRCEDFGLLFYDSRSTRLTYVRSRDGLVPPPFTGSRRLLRVGPMDDSAHSAIAALLDNLVEKGLLVVESVD